MSFRFLLVDTSGDVTGLNDNVPDISDCSNIICIIDTQEAAYCNDDLDDEPIGEHDADDE